MGRFLEIANRIIAEERSLEDTLDDLPDTQVKTGSHFSTAEKAEPEGFTTERRKKTNPKSLTVELNQNNNPRG